MINTTIAKIYNFIKSLKFTILLLSLIAFLSAIGTVADNVAFIKNLGLSNIYYSKWFILLLVLFVLNLTLCTLSMIPVTKALFNPKAQNRIFYFNNLQDKNRHLIKLLKSKGLYVREINGFIAGFRYPFRKIAVYGIHLGVFVVAVGAVVSSLWGFRGVTVIPEGAESNVVMLRSGKTATLPFYVYNKNFSVKFYKDKSIPFRYKTIGYIHDNGKKTPFTVMVNHPFRYKGVWFYQDAYNLNPKHSSIKLRVNENTITLPLHEPVLYNNDKYYLAAMNMYNNKPIALVYIRVNSGLASGWIKLGQKVDVGSIKIKFTKADISYITILGVSKDPGSPFILTGFIFIALSSMLVFFKFRRRVYAIKRPINS